MNTVLMEEQQDQHTPEESQSSTGSTNTGAENEAMGKLGEDHPAEDNEDSPSFIQLQDEVIRVIKTCYDPEIPVDIYELGLIYEVKVDPGNNVFVTMTLTSPNCPVAESLPLEVEQKIRTIPNVNAVKLELTFEPPWTMDLMSEAAKLELNMF